MRDFNGAIEVLNKLQTNFSVIQEIHRSGQKPRDEELVPEMLEWTRRIGYNAKDFDRMNVVHITGTKGKGSTSAFTSSILQQYVNAGDSRIHKVGMYTSPHLKSIRERIMIDGAPISVDKFTKYFFDVYDRLNATSSSPERFPRMGRGVLPNYFRYLTLVSFHAFMTEGVDSAVYEVGIGGEYDSTNVFVKPTATAVSALGIDHVNVLGDTIEEIAWNKSGIFKPGCPAFTVASQQPAAGLQVLEDRAVEKGTKLTVVPLNKEIERLTLGLNGEFQNYNATLAAYLAATRLGLDISNGLPAEFAKGLEKTTLAGRCQVVKRKGVTWYIDGAHTAESLVEAAKWFAKAVQSKDKPVVLLFNQQKRDNVQELLESLYLELKKFGVTVSDAYFSTNQSWAAGYQADMISHNVSREQVEKLTVQKALASSWKTISPESEVHVCECLEDVVNSIKQEQQVFVTGSLLMVGGLLTIIDP